MIRMNKISKTYPLRGGGLQVLRSVSLHIPAGSYAAFIGPSGSGKSTLMHILGCLDAPTSGEYRLDGADVGSLTPPQLCEMRKEKIGFVFQGYQLMDKLNAEENVAFPLMLRGIREEERLRIAREALERMGLGGREKHRPSELSGGQQQRVALARALCVRPRLLLCDEPTGALDEESRDGILLLLDQLHAEGRTIVLITHDSRVAQRARVRYRVEGGLVTPCEEKTNLL